MDLTPYAEALREDLATAAEAAGPQGRELAERLMAPMDAAIRLTLLEALSAAAADITSDLAPGSVEVRLRGKEPEFVVTPPPVMEQEAALVSRADEPAAWLPADGDDTTMSRINLRLPQDLKDRVEEAARTSGLSVNAWLVRSTAAALPGSDSNGPTRRRARGGDSFTGWVR